MFFRGIGCKEFAACGFRFLAQSLFVFVVDVVVLFLILEVAVAAVPYFGFDMLHILKLRRVVLVAAAAVVLVGWEANLKRHCWHYRLTSDRSIHAQTQTQTSKSLA